MGRVLEISGTRQNIALASYVYDFVRHFIAAEWNRYNTGRGHHRNRKTDFAVGIIEGFSEKLARRQKPSPLRSSGRSLVTVQDTQLDAYMAHRYPNTRSVRTAPVYQDEEIHMDGKRIGEKLVIHRGIAEKPAGGGRLIEQG